ncbi:BofC C-terminal domain-containing protein [Acidaminobacterium chupaoyuni]
MRSKKWRLGVLSCAFVCAVGLSAGAMLHSSSTAATVPPKSTVSSVPLQESPLYILRDYNGKIAVFPSFDAQTPNFVTDFDVAALPQQDRQYLAEGIPLKTAEELQQILEDYGS